MPISKEQKEKFVHALLRQEDPFKAALAVWPDDVGTALYASNSLPNDPEVIELKEQAIRENGQEAFLPTKADLAKAVWDLANCTDNDEAIKAFKLYGDIMGFIETGKGKAPSVTVNNLVDARKVLLVKDHGTDDEWANKVALQQKKLIEDGAKPLVVEAE